MLKYGCEKITWSILQLLQWNMLEGKLGARQHAPRPYQSNAKSLKHVERSSDFDWDGFQTYFCCLQCNMLHCYMLLQCVCAFARDTTDILDNCVLKNTITWSHHHNSNDPNWKWPRHKSWGARGVLSLCFPVPGSIVHFALGSYYHVQWECSLEPRPGWLSCWVSTWPASDFRLPSRSFSLTRFFSFGSISNIGSRAVCLLLNGIKEDQTSLWMEFYYQWQFSVVVSQFDWDWQFAIF